MQAIVQQALYGLHGRIMNFNSLAGAVRTLNQWYEDRGVLGQVIDVEMGPGNLADIKVAEAVVSRINLRFMDPKSGEASARPRSALARGACCNTPPQPCLVQVRDEGKTRPEVILRNVGTRPGEVRRWRYAAKGLGNVATTLWPRTWRVVGAGVQPAPGQERY